MNKKLAAIFLVFSFSTLAMAAERNLIDLHKQAAQLKSQECLSCHASGTGKAKMPDNHAGRTNENCALCHTVQH